MAWRGCRGPAVAADVNASRAMLAVKGMLTIVEAGVDGTSWIEKRETLECQLSDGACACSNLRDKAFFYMPNCRMYRKLNLTMLAHASPTALDFYPWQLTLEPS